MAHAKQMFMQLAAEKEELLEEKAGIIVAKEIEELADLRAVAGGLGEIQERDEPHDGWQGGRLVPGTG
jgi:hypothetical protein